jgi:excisionase family DNA binding protein
MGDQGRVPLFVRLPERQAAALDRLVDSTGRRKQQVVSELLGEQLGVGRIEVSETAPPPSEEVLTLEEVAELLRLPTRLLRQRMSEAGPPGRRFGGEWRFARAAVIEWLAAGDAGADGGAGGDA